MTEDAPPTLGALQFSFGNTPLPPSADIAAVIRGSNSGNDGTWSSSSGGVSSEGSPHCSFSSSPRRIKGRSQLQEMHNKNREGAAIMMRGKCIRSIST